MATWNLAARARREFADMIEGLGPEQLDQPSLCSEWTAKGVLAHVVSFVDTGLGSFFGGIVRSGFNFDRASVAMVDKRIDRPADELLATLRAKATKSAPLPMFPEEMTVSDVAIHTQDVRRPLGLDGSLDADVLRTALEFLTTHKMATTMVNRRPIDDVRLVATDIDWSHGAGAEISGPGEAILMALANRPVLDELGGEGLGAWK